MQDHIESAIQHLTLCDPEAPADAFYEFLTGLKVSLEIGGHKDLAQSIHAIREQYKTDVPWGPY